MKASWVLTGLALVLLVPAASAFSVTVHAGTNPDGSLYFQPKDVRATKGDSVTLTVVNDDSDKAHDWQLLSYGGKDIEAYTAAGQSKTITFTASETGTFRVICGVVTHKQLGMEGHFIVADKSFLPAPEPALALAMLAVVAIAVRRR